jgi:Short C-terminal domain
MVVQSARQFAAKVNQLAQKLAAEQMAAQQVEAGKQAAEQVTADHADRTSAPTQSITDQIRDLAELRDQGILTSEEFNTKKAELLARL